MDISLCWVLCWLAGWMDGDDTFWDETHNNAKKIAQEYRVYNQYRSLFKRIRRTSFPASYSTEVPQSYTAMFFLPSPVLPPFPFHVHTEYNIEYRVMGEMASRRLQERDARRMSKYSLHEHIQVRKTRKKSTSSTASSPFNRAWDSRDG